MTTRPPGRPRSDAARRAVLAAATELLRSDGYGTLTMEGIARRAGVSKQTIYRWWPSKAAIILEALTEGAHTLAPLPDSGDLATDLKVLLRNTVAAVDANRHLLAALMAEAQLDDHLATAFRDGFLSDRRDTLRDVLNQAQSRGEINDTPDIELLIDIILGALWYRVLGHHAPLNRKFADQLTQTMLTLGRPSPARIRS